MSESRLLPAKLISELQAIAIESDKDIEDGVLLPNWPLNSINDLKSLILRRFQILNSQHIAAIFKYLASLDHLLQQELQDTTNRVTQRCIDVLSDKQISTLKPAELVDIISSLPKLPVSISKKAKPYLSSNVELSNELPASVNAKIHAELVSLLIKHLVNTIDKMPYTLPACSTILLTFAKIDLNLIENSKLIMSLLKPFEKISTSSHAHFFGYTAENLWQFCVFILEKAKASDEIKLLCEAVHIQAIFAETNKYLAKKHKKNKATPMSNLQKKLTTIIKKLLNDEAKNTLEIELYVGAYPLDIAILSPVKLNIEIDGPTHYRDESLARQSRFRDYVLSAYDDWKIIRIPYYEWQLLDIDSQVRYLLIKLSPYSAILKTITSTQDEEKTVISEEPQNNTLFSTSLASLFSTLPELKLPASSHWKLTKDTPPQLNLSGQTIPRKMVKTVKDFSKANGLDIDCEETFKKSGLYSLSINTNCRRFNFFKSLNASVKVFSERELSEKDKIFSMIYEYTSSKSGLR